MSMASYLIPYVDPRKMEGHEDPMLDEFTYGDSSFRGKKLLDGVNKGDALFFHTASKNRRVITAYYYIEDVMPVDAAKNDSLIMNKYKNPHLKREVTLEHEVIVFGNPIRSLILRNPLPLTLELLSGLSKPVIKKDDNQQSDFQFICSALRTWKEISNSDVELLLGAISGLQEKERLQDVYLSNEEIIQLDEIDIEDYLVNNPKNLNPSYQFVDRQVVLDSNFRVDVLLKNEASNELIVVEIKKGMIGKEVYKQIHGYMKEMEPQLWGRYGLEKMKGIIVCNGILPAFEDYYYDLVKKKDIEVKFYAWKFSFRDF